MIRIFTTKGPGEGSGMGLAVTQGIVKAHHGGIVVHSELAVGTHFDVWFPVSAEALAPDIEKKVALCLGSERILFVDDEPALAEICQKMLESLGYRVDVQTSSTGALEIFKAQPSSFDLVITDMTMPGLTGTELAGKILAIRPDQAIILCTGFSEQVNARQAQALGIREFLMKPWDVTEMSVLIRKVLDQDKMKKA